MRLERGVINNPELANQPVIWPGMVYGRISPTDIDAVIDFKGLLYIFIELKHQGTDLTIGQRILLERMSDGLSKRNCVAVSIVAHHTCLEEIILPDCTASLIRHNRTWHNVDPGWNVKDLVNRLRREYLPEHILNKTGGKWV